MILFVPFQNKAGLILDGETVEEAFQHHRNDNDSLNMHHDKLQSLLGAEKKWKEIQDARKSIGLGEAEEAELKNRDDDEPQLLGEIMDAVNDIADVVVEWLVWGTFYLEQRTIKKALRNSRQLLQLSTTKND